MQTLTAQALNRATLARQSLLSRSDRRPAELIEHLVGLQAQAPLAPYVALWSRLVDFQPDELGRLLTQRQAVRTSLMRATIHLVTARDAALLREVLQPMLAQRFAHSPFAGDLVGVDLAEVRALGTELLTDHALTRAELGAGLARRWPDRDPFSLAYAVTFQVPLVHVPPRGIWGETGPVRQQTTAAWLRPADPECSIVDRYAENVDSVVTRYLGGFGPASVRDIQAWSGLTRLREVTERLRPGLCTFRDEHGVELFDLPDAPRPDPDTPAPPRFLPEYDNVLLSHADRSRIIPDGRRVPLYPGNGAALGTVLLDGRYRADWKLDRSGPRVRLLITPFAALKRGEQTALQQEARALLSLIAPTTVASTTEVEIGPGSGK
jgi:hypothetical protein